MAKCKVCGSPELHKENSYICKLRTSKCKHEWGEETIELGDNKCINCGEGYKVYQCTKCDMHSALHWSETFYHDNGGCIADD